MPDYIRDEATLRSIFANNPLHPSGFDPVAVIDSEPPMLVYYHDEDLITVVTKGATT